MRRWPVPRFTIYKHYSGRRQAVKAKAAHNGRFWADRGEFSISEKFIRPIGVMAHLWGKLAVNITNRTNGVRKRYGKRLNKLVTYVLCAGLRESSPNRGQMIRAATGSR